MAARIDIARIWTRRPWSPQSSANKEGAKGCHARSSCACLFSFKDSVFNASVGRCRHQAVYRQAVRPKLVTETDQAYIAVNTCQFDLSCVGAPHYRLQVFNLISAADVAYRCTDPSGDYTTVLRRVLIPTFFRSILCLLQK
eukprot:IDg23601t1